LFAPGIPPLTRVHADVMNEPARGLRGMTLKFAGKARGPSRVVLANTRGLGAPWDVPPQKAGGDSAVFLFWGHKNLKHGEKRTMTRACGADIASDPEPGDNGPG